MRKSTGKIRMERKILERLLSEHGINKIIRELHVGKRRVGQVKRRAIALGYFDGVPVPAFPAAVFSEEKRAVGFLSGVDEQLSGRLEWITERLEAGWQPITVYEELGIKVGRSSFYRFLKRHSLFEINRRRRVVPEIVHKPGEALLLDWGKLRDVKDPMTGKKQALWAFVGVLGFSRYMMVKLVWSNDVPTTLAAIESMFQELGGVPSRITSDNPKCFALEASKYEPLLNPAFERFGAHYNTLIECLPPADPEKKGKVERPMPYVRRLYQAHGDAWSGLEESQAYMNRKVTLANERKHGTTDERPIDRLLGEETQALKSLPALSYEIEEYHEGKVRKDGHVRFANKYYSVDENFIDQEVTVLGNSKLVSIYHNGKLLEVHERLTDKYRSKSTKLNHLKPWERAMGDHSHYRTRALKIGADVERLVMILLEQGQGFIDTKKIWGILSLDKTFDAAAINEACRTAIDLQSYSYRTVRGLLTLKPQAQAVATATATTAQVNVPNENKVQKKSSNKFVRSLSEYKEQMKLFH